ncbi:prepilin-type N-terminal cleavage/methylation domain-containing protein [Candidatus Gracilibacteria bacterium]|nr:prepilin-type N-terminal cleavage/methylation domain-containing protein [Candidatus Gracilibacteria bacterium]
MKNQKGFTLVELMVVMAIIAILSTAGISQYGRFIKSARDTTRLTDLDAINIVLVDSIQSTGVVPDDVSALEKYIREVAGKEISEALGNNANACMDATSKPTSCGYHYIVCDGGTGYLIATGFESKSNIDKYKKDDVSGTALDENRYELGSCEVPNNGTNGYDSASLIRSTKNMSSEAA